jgi:sarcosine oxidase subunit beta
VIGGGVIGASVAYHLARKGVRDIIVLDSAKLPGEGSTGRATGGYRAQFATDINVRLSLLSREALLSFEEDTGVSPGYTQVGYLWIASSDRELEGIRRGIATQRNAGLADSREITPDEISELNPAISIEGIVGGSFCPTDGYIQPLEILRGYLSGCAQMEVDIRWDTGCTGFEMRGDSVAAVRTQHESIDVGTVVNAAGPWARSIAQLAGVDLPVAPLRRQAAITRPTDAIPASMPMTIFLHDGFHLRARDGRALLCWPTACDGIDPFDTSVEPDWLESVASMMRDRVPALRNAEIDRSICYGGLYEMSPDKHPIVGYATECDNMFLVNGSSGHGVMHSPALGRIAASLICGEESPLDVSCLRPSRFLEGDAIPSSELL